MSMLPGPRPAELLIRDVPPEAWTLAADFAHVFAQEYPDREHKNMVVYTSPSWRGLSFGVYWTPTRAVVVRGSWGEVRA